MNQVFSINRFGRLLRKYFTDNRGSLLANLALLMSGLVVCGAIIYGNYPYEVDMERVTLLFLIGWPAWYLFTIQQVTVLNNKERTRKYLMQPASQVEKMLLIWLISGPGFLLVYTGLFAVLDGLGIAFVNGRSWTPEQLEHIRAVAAKFELKPIFNGSSLRDIPGQLWAYSALIHAFTLSFALLIRRYTLALVALVALALVIFGFIGNNYLLHQLTGTVFISSPTPFSDAIASTYNQSRSIELPQPLGNQLRYLVLGMLIMLLYATAYFRLREREV